MSDNFTLDLADEAATLQFGARLARAIAPHLTLYLHGDLGAGKTTLVRGLLHALGYVGKVKSPTYTLVESYQIQYNDTIEKPLRLTLYHFDLYRFNDEEEWEAAGFRDYFNAESVCVIEWPEKAQNVLPTPDIHLTFTIKQAGRSVHLTAHSTLGQQCLQQISTPFSTPFSTP